MKKNIHILLAATLLFGATSCEDFLQKDPPSSPSQSVFWQKKSDFESLWPEPIRSCTPVYSLRLCLVWTD